MAETGAVEKADSYGAAEGRRQRERKGIVPERPESVRSSSETEPVESHLIPAKLHVERPSEVHDSKVLFLVVLSDSLNSNRICSSSTGDELPPGRRQRKRRSSRRELMFDAAILKGINK
ncbi:hypothetical protein GW17_00039785 [Ensete ventricosum]|nr:hypothetical protein GW17_00039785 [Ensete ventricosum]